MLGAALWLWLAPPQAPIPDTDRDPTPSAGADDASARVTSFGDETLSAEDIAGLTDVVERSEDPSLPPLQSVTRDSLPELIALAQASPDDRKLRMYVARAHLVVADRAIESKRYELAHRYLDDSEEWGAGSGWVGFRRALIFGRQEQWEKARRWAETNAHPGNPHAAELYYFVGMADLESGWMDSASRWFERALEVEDNPRYRAALDLARRGPEEAPTVRTARAGEKRIAHFYVSYDGETMEQTGRLVLDSLERSHAALVSQLGFEPPQPVSVILYTRRDYSIMGGPHWSAGFYTDGKIHVPVRGLLSVDRQIETTLRHELAHAFIDAKAGPRAPRWLHEGIAQYVENPQGRRNPAPEYETGNRGSTHRDYERRQVQNFYASAASIVDYMVQLRGMGGIRDVLDELNQGKSIDEALTRVMGKNEAALREDWERRRQRRR